MPSMTHMPLVELERAGILKSVIIQVCKKLDSALADKDNDVVASFHKMEEVIEGEKRRVVEEEVKKNDEKRKKKKGLKQLVRTYITGNKVVKTSAVCGPHLQSSTEEEVVQTSAVCSKKTVCFFQHLQTA
ncbi:hypothetical protein LXL04_021638 [Taraxacum kok-saghyz]